MPGFGAAVVAGREGGAFVRVGIEARLVDHLGSASGRAEGVVLVLNEIVEGESGMAGREDRGFGRAGCGVGLAEQPGVSSRAGVASVEAALGEIFEEGV